MSTRAAIRSRRFVFWLACALALALATPAGSAGDVFGPISLVSVGSVGGGAPQQVEYAHDAAISGNGRYVAFDGSVAGHTGVWRRDLATGAIEQVAPGDAELPSISDSGRYISFTTTVPLVPEDETRGPNVWVRDMEAAGEAPSFRLVSAVNGAEQGLTYAYPVNPSVEVQKFGAVAAGRSAISADGQRVAFVTSATSNLVRYPELEAEEEAHGEVPRPHTPPWQVAVRDLATQETMLVSGEYDRAANATATDKPVSSVVGEQTIGAAYAGAATAPGFRLAPAYAEWNGNPSPGASISADGSTVAWLGVNVGEQARMLPSEQPAPLYTEPLWRRIAPGSQTPTMRVTGGSEPENPACAASGEGEISNTTPASDPCQGPFVVEPEEAASHAIGIWPTENEAVEVGDFVPRLSGDGYEVAFVSGALPLALGENFGNHLRGEPADAYVADMHPGPTRRAALRSLTALAGAQGIAQIDPIDDLEISRDGTQVAFTTRRTQFPLPSPAFVSPPATEPALSELFDADLADATLTRVTGGYEGGPSEQPHQAKKAGEEDVYGTAYGAGAQSPSFSADGTLIAFSSTASNLAFGDANTPPAGPLDGSDAFLVARQLLGTLLTPQSISPPPSTTTEPAWILGATAVARRDGSVLLYVQVPGAGALRADASSALAVSASGRSAATRRRGSRRAARAHATGRHVRIVIRTVASARKTITTGGELVTLLLRPASKYRSLISRRGGLLAGVKVSFAASGHPTLSQSLEVVFHTAARTARKGHGASKHAKGRR